MDFSRLHARKGRYTLSRTPEGADGLVLAELAASSGGRGVLHIARDGHRLEKLEAALAFFSPGREVLTLPAWDCLPYDRLSPHPDIVAERIDTLTRLAAPRALGAPARIVLASVGAAVQRMPAREAYARAALALKVGDSVDQEKLVRILADNGYNRSDTVMEPGEYAVRGGIVDVYPPGVTEPLRIDFFGDRIETIRSFDPMSQRTTAPRDAAIVKPVSEVLLTPETVARFRGGYRELFGAGGDDPLYSAVSEGHRHVGMEHWLPLFHEKLETVFDYLPDALVTLDQQLIEARDARLDMIEDYYRARKDMDGKGKGFSGEADYRPMPPSRLYVDKAEWTRRLSDRTTVQLSTFEGGEGGDFLVDLGGRRHEGFAKARTATGVNLFDAVAAHVAASTAAKRKVLFAAFSPGSADRLASLLREHGVGAVIQAEDWSVARAAPPGAATVVVLPIDNGFVLQDIEVIGEEDILGDRLVRPKPKRRPSERFIAEASAISEGDLVVHREHGVGRYDGLVTLEIQGARHDCLRLVYDGGDKLFVPVENIDVLSRYGSEETAALDRLGGAAWQSRKAKLKQRIRDIADRLIKVAAERAVRSGEVIAAADGPYDEFCARFPYSETDDQLNAIGDVLDDMASGRPMDRLVCGDVGFGKTEVALRAAFVAAMGGKQVAVVAPTTLLARQHHKTFVERFAGFPIRIGRLSRLTPAKEVRETKAAMEAGEIDIVCGTHAVLGKSVSFKDLGLLIVDEEQHFGVAHKERLKEFKADVHVLTLTATPIPRTLQMALSGVRDMSLIATPPVDRLAVRTFVTPFDPVSIREALLREQYRGGQSYYVCPRIEDLDGIATRLRELVPEIKFAMAHGRLPPAALEDTMQAFVDGQYDLLLSTNIVESGLDIRNANTMVIHRADMLGLSQLYQLRGRIGRSKTRAYAYLTVPPGRALNETAQKRLEVMQTLDTLGAGFQLASHDLDIRGAGNLLGEEQSGHIREVGIELYQQLLEEAVEAARGQVARNERADWQPQINLGMPVLIPDDYVADLGVRLALYRRIAALQSRAEIDSLAAEIVDRFGRMPLEVDNLLRTVALKLLCRAAGVEKIDAGARGVLIAFHENKPSNPGKLISLIQREAATMRLRPDHRLVVTQSWGDERKRFDGVAGIVETLAKLAA